MTIFWIIASGLIGSALLFVLPPLVSRREPAEDPSQDALNLTIFRRQLEELDRDLAAGELDQQQYDAARHDLERELLYGVGPAGSTDKRDTGGGRWAAALLAVAIPLVVVSIYLYLGDSAIIPRLQAAASGKATQFHPGREGKMPPLEVMVQRLAEKLEQNPDNLEGWMMLGRTYFAIGQPERALHPLERAYGLAPRNPDILVTYAEALAANNGDSLAGRPAELIQAALKIDPQHTSARWLEGLASFQGARYAEAAEQWGALAASFDPQSDEAAELHAYVTEARSRAGPEQQQQEAKTAAEPKREQGALPATDDAADTKEQIEPLQVASSASVTVEVSLAEPLWRQVNANDSVFIYAKAVSGPPMPLAAYRARVGDLPLTVTLDDSMAMIPAMKLSQFDEVTLGARISKGGQATPQSGDLEGEVSPVKPGQSGTVKILIERARP